MAYPLIKTDTLEPGPTLLVTVGLLGIFMNQSNVLFGFNLSLADFALVLFILVMVMNRAFTFPVTTLTIFNLFSFFLLWNSVFIIPTFYRIPFGPTAFLKDFLKICVCLLYFCSGSLLSQKKLTGIVLKWFLLFATLTAFIGLVSMFLPIPYFSETMFYDGSRLIGFMNDPNYFAVIQCAALAVALRIPLKAHWLRSTTTILLVLSIVASGSKTGFITLACFFLLRIYHMIKEGKLKSWKLFLTLISITSFLLISPVLGNVLTTVLNLLTQNFPIFSRVEVLLTDFTGAVSSGGSSRNVQWLTGLKLIQQNPIAGVGIGENYLRLASHITRDANIAHNTYLQMAAEWGIPVTAFLLLVIAKSWFTTKDQQVVKEMFFVFLIGSMAISFHYSRFFWLLFGMMVYQDKKEMRASHETFS